MDELYLQKMLIILNKVDSVMKDFKLDTFYEVYLLEMKYYILIIHSLIFL